MCAVNQFRIKVMAADQQRIGSDGMRILIVILILFTLMCVRAIFLLFRTVYFDVHRSSVLKWGISYITVKIFQLGMIMVSYYLVIILL